MLLCFGSWKRAGGVNALFESYYKRLKIEVPHLWILIGNEPVPSSCFKKNTHSFVIEDDWNIYLDKDLCKNINRKIKTLVEENHVKGLFLPLEYHLFPCIRGIKLPVLYISHLLNKPLIESAEKQWYSKLPETQRGIKADRIRLQVEREALSSCRYIICNSNVTKRDLIKHYSIPDNVKMFVSEPGTVKKFWERIDPGERNQALYFGRLTHQKGIPNIIKLKTNSLNMTVLGKGKMESLFQEKEKNQYNFTGWVESDKLKEYLNKALFCLFPSHYEPWGLSLNEALAAGKICIAQKGAGGHELQIKNGINGFLTDFNNQDALSKIKEVGEDQKNIKLISENARNSAHDIRSHLQRVSRVITQFYSECL